MMPCESYGLARVLCRSLQDILSWTVVLDEVEIGCRELLEPMSEIPHHRYRLQKHFRQNDRRADIQENAAAVELFNHRTEEAKIVVGCFSHRFARGLRVG